MSRLLVRITTAVLLTVAAHAAERIDLNGAWQFRTDAAQEGLARQWFKTPPGATATVDVPHTWNIGKYADYEGTAWYFRSFSLPAGALGKHIELHFGATNYLARVWVNGVEAGTHEGGHTAWHIDVSKLVKARNSVAVWLDNRPTEATIPGFALDMGRVNVWYDWWHYGGIARDAWLTVNEPVLLRRQHVRSKIVSGNADATNEVFVENFGAEAAKAKLRVVYYAPTGEVAAQTEQAVEAAPGASTVKVATKLAGVKLWHFDTPNVYRVETTLTTEQGDVLDVVTDNYGFRTLMLENRRLYLNGERVRLTGLERHAESPYEGLAETRGTMLRDYSEMKELQVTFTRPVHYPQHPYVFDFCDRNGILLVPEIPIWHFNEKQFTDPRVIALAKQMMTEMIEQNWNHPSIFAWSTYNESASDTPGGVAFFRDLKTTIRALDPDRYVTYADDHIVFGADPAKNAASDADFVMMNEYAGTWHGDPGRLERALQRAGREYPGKMIVISEFGVAGIFGKDKVEGDALRRRILRDQLELMEKYDYVGGAILWCYQDYRSHRNIRPGLSAGYVEMGLVDENRQRYESYELWKELNAPAEVRLSFRFDGIGLRPAGLHARIARRAADQIPSYALHGYTARWEVRDQDNAVVAKGEKTLPDIGAAQTLGESFNAPKATALHLKLTLVRPTGYVAFERTIDWSAGPSGGELVPEMEKRGYKIP